MAVCERHWDSEAEGYLRAFDDDLGGALGLLVRDIVATLGWSTSRAEAAVWHEAEWIFDGYFLEIPTGGEVLLVVADRIQEHIIESGYITWPECPHHPNRPLWLIPDDRPTAMWTCTTSDVPVARIGELAASI